MDYSLVEDIELVCRNQTINRILPVLLITDHIEVKLQISLIIFFSIDRTELFVHNPTNVDDLLGTVNRFFWKYSFFSLGVRNFLHINNVMTITKDLAKEEHFLFTSMIGCFVVQIVLILNVDIVHLKRFHHRIFMEKGLVESSRF